MKPAVLMTDPRHFSIRGGANPHTRRPDGRLKVVEIARAWPQWHAYVDALLDGGVDVYVIDAAPRLTGMVFAANAGFIPERLDDVPSHEKRFYPSHFTVAHRKDEAAVFADFMARFGFRVGTYDEAMLFEGEADGFPVGRGKAMRWIFTYGFRSDPQVAGWMADQVGDTALELRLTDPKYYHGDTLICDLGGKLLAWKGGLDEASAGRLEAALGERIVALDDADAGAFIGNSFYVETDADRLLYTPAEIAEATRERIEAEGVRVVPVDISEFFGKGGGGPKCMVFNLGRVGVDEPGLTTEQKAFRQARHVETLRREEYFPG